LSQAADFQTNFTNIGSIANTRHNLTQSTAGVGEIMNTARNNYGEVCVYCHTPHGANGTINAPLWNRTNNFTDGKYTTYDNLGTSTLTASVAQPGANSLTCLSCHDGTLGIDSIINMPGSGLYNSNSVSQSNTFLNGWDNPGTPLEATNRHYGLNETGCLTCHNGSEFAPAADFSIYKIGIDLTNDHPIGIDLPTGRIGDDFVGPNATAPGVQFYDRDGGNGRADTDEIRFYDTGAGPRVECASCHDPHGVIPRNGEPGVTEFNPTFLRISNNESAVCLTCHDK